MKFTLARIIYKNFLNGESKLIDGFKDSHPELYKQLLDLWLILSKNHKYFATPVTTKSEKKEAASTCAEFTKKYPVYFKDLP